MNTVTLLQPPRIVFGNGCASQCVDFFAQRMVKRPLLVTSKSVRPQLDPIIAALKSAGVEVIECHFVPPEPTVKFFELAVADARDKQIDSVLSIGGGSVMDIGKLIAALAGGRQQIDEVFGVNLLAGRELPLVCLPTTAGTVLRSRLTPFYWTKPMS